MCPHRGLPWGAAGPAGGPATEYPRASPSRSCVWLLGSQTQQKGAWGPPWGTVSGAGAPGEAQGGIVNLPDLVVMSSKALKVCVGLRRQRT